MSELSRVARAREYVRTRPLNALLVGTAVAVTGWVLVAPFAAVKYPPIADLPMQASVTSMFRHWFDPAWHFRDQFELQLLHVPLITTYVIGAVLALILPISWAVKLAALAMMTLLPVGLAVYLYGMKKNPLWGVAAAAFAWGPLTQWGFLSYVGALGLTMMGLGVTHLLLDRPTRGRTIALGSIGIALLLTHISRFPFFGFAVGITTLCMFPVTHRIKQVVVALIPSSVLFVIWWLIRPQTLRGPVEYGWHFDRIIEIRRHVFGSVEATDEPGIMTGLGAIVAGVVLYALVVNGAAAWRRGVRRPSLQQVCAFSGALLVSLMFAALFFSLPMKIGVWWFVYPREMTAALLCALALVPSLPSSPLLSAPAVIAALVAITLPMKPVLQEYADFDVSTQDFQHLISELPLAPKLGYVIWDNHDYATHVMRPLIHLPAWAQAEHGGWLSFHFATWNATPVRFRTDEGKDVAPETPDGFEWHPDTFDFQTRGKYFDWFLVHAHATPDTKVADPALHMVDHQGSWWLYKRG